ncbi:hypothetical protein BH23CHL5_BH23CHL5_14580 [soil metagenome]
MASRPTDRSTVSMTALSIAGYVLVTLLGFTLRAVALAHYGGHVDEPASLLAVNRVGDVGYPQFPSGVLYLQGAAFSYIAAPMTWILDDTALLQATRVLSMFISVSVIPLSMKLMLETTGSSIAALITGILVSADPNLILWSVTIRPYGLLAAEIVALLILFSRLLREGPSARLGPFRVVYLIPILSTAGTFTHVGFWLAFPVLALVAVTVWQKSLLTTHRVILLSGLLSLLPLLVLLALGSFSSTGSGTGDGYFGRSFLGSHLFSLKGFRESPGLRFWIWTDNFTDGVLHQFMPYLILLSSGVLFHAILEVGSGTISVWRRLAVGSIVLVHWSVIVAVALLVTSDPAPRYLTLILPLGYMIITLAGLSLWTLAPRSVSWLTAIIRIAVVVVFIVPGMLQAGTAASLRIHSPGGSPDYWNATKWASVHFDNDQTILTALPPSAHFWFSQPQLERLKFLAGPESSSRTSRYVVTDSRGAHVDYWLGLSSIRSTQELCIELQRIDGNGGIIADGHRLRAGWAFEGPFAEVIRGSSEIVFRGDNGVVVMSILPFENWSDAARTACG